MEELTVFVSYCSSKNAVLVECEGRCDRRAPIHLSREDQIFDLLIQVFGKERVYWN